MTDDIKDEPSTAPEEAGNVPVRAPELVGAVDWLNVTAPLTLSALRGKIVLLEFWTYGCINCLHQLPGLKRLAAAHTDHLVVIGIHSPKFPNERSTENLRQIVARHDITHPVANDADFRIWREYTVRAWPTLALIDPAGYLVGGASGEGHLPQFEQAITAVAQVFSDRGALRAGPLAEARPEATVPSDGLAFPGKVAVDTERDRVFVADTCHDQIVVATLAGIPITRIGAGHSGADDGSFAEACFTRPQGMAVRPEDGCLLVADTGNHLIREVDVDAARVRTLAGNTDQARRGAAGGGAVTTSISSPWDLAQIGQLLFIAMAGVHQLWVLDAERGFLFPYAGSGLEARQDGGLDDSAFAQPSGLAWHKDTLFVADSESNVIRAVDLPPVNSVRTLAGGDLFDFGDTDGVGDAVRLQHPLAVAYHDGALYVSDTYNHRIKRLDLGTRRVTAFAGSGKPGLRDGRGARARFYEPGGLAVAGGRLLVADTNNHALRAVDLNTAVVSTVIGPHAPLAV
jgi:DNA-binding beta-propeller fold protein YncE